MEIGVGSYGTVFSKDNKAVKKFSKLSHLIQEYIALKYLNPCDYIVHAKDVDFANLELHMELFDESLRDWIEKRRKYHSENNNDIMRVIHDIILGLIELHDRGLTHGDIKPSNILVMNKPFKLVLGDCGFTSIAKYAKVERTASVYRDPVISNEPSHDMFSFGICFLELISGVRINHQASYKELREITIKNVSNSEHQKLIYNLLHEDKNRRPDARFVLNRLFNENPPEWVPYKIINDNRLKNNGRIICSIPREYRSYIRKFMHEISNKYYINRSQKGYGALLVYLDDHKITYKLYKFHIAIVMMILSALFGKSGFREKNVLELCSNKYDISELYKTLENLLSDDVFIKLLLTT